MKAKIIGFTKYPDGEDKDCIAITDDGKEVVVDPFVGCSWEYKNRKYLLNEWFEDPNAWQHKDGVWLTDEHTFKIIPMTKPPQEITRTLFQHQKDGVEFLKNKKRAILADEMGLGKTRQAIVATGEESDETVVVVCPASLKVNWEREIHIVYPEDGVLVVSGGEWPEGDTSSWAWIVINYDILEKHKEWIINLEKEGEIETVIFDEAHYIKDTRTIRTKAALAVAENAKRVYCLTGTPVMNRPIELFSLLRAVQHPLAYSDDKASSTLRKEFGKRYCAAYFHRLGYSARGFWDESGASRLPELRELTRSVFLRRTKAEVLDLPPKIVSVVSCELDSEWRATYDSAWDKYLEWVASHPEGRDINNILTAQAMIEIGKLKQVCSLAKIHRIKTDIENAIEQGEKVIVFSQYTESIKTIAAVLSAAGIRAVTLTGADDQESRQQAVDAFQTDPDTKIFIANIKAGGIGLTLTAASIVVFADMEWSPEIHRQAEDRAHRIGTQGTVNVYYYIAESTVEEDIIDILTAKQETIGVLTDGDTTIKAFMDRLIERTKKA